MPPAAKALLSLVCLVLCLMVAGLADKVVAQEVRVTTPEELQEALQRRQGDTILLAPGDYGDLRIENQEFPAQLLLVADPPRRAVFHEIRLKNVSGVSFDGIITHQQFRADDVTGLRLSGCLAKDMLYFRNVSDLEISNCDVSGGRYGVLFNSVARFSISHSHVHQVAEDLMRITGDSHDGLIENNTIGDVIAKKGVHPDIIQFFHAKGKVPHDITIRRNLLYDDPGTGQVAAQGLFVSDPGKGPQNKGYANILIEENLISSRSPNTIFLNSARHSVIVRNNTLIPRDGGGGNIRLVGASFGDGGPKITGNVFKLMRDETGVMPGPARQNLVYGDTAPLRLFSGPGQKWQDFLPVLGSPLDQAGLGAVTFLRDMQAAKSGAMALLGPDWAE